MDLAAAVVVVAAAAVDSLLFSWPDSIDVVLYCIVVVPYIDRPCC
jgi:hypothetical protein